MKKAELQELLAEMGLDTKGTREVLALRYVKALDEKAQEEEKARLYEKNKPRSLLALAKKSTPDLITAAQAKAAQPSLVSVAKAKLTEDEEARPERERSILEAIAAGREGVAIDFISAVPFLRIDYVIETSDGFERTLLMWATAAANARIIANLLGRKANPDAGNSVGGTALLLACQDGHMACVEQLIEAKASIDLGMHDGTAPLHRACSAGQLVVAKALLTSGANVDVADKRGRTPLHTACQLGNERAARLLLSSGAAVNRGDRDGASPLLQSCDLPTLRYGMVDLLVRSQADVNQVSHVVEVGSRH